MDDDLYDDFGNYIGPELVDDDDANNSDWVQRIPVVASNIDDDDDDDQEMNNANNALISSQFHDDDDYASSNAIVLHEDKKYYPSAEEVYGPDTETLVMDEDAQAITEPIVSRIKRKNFDESGHQFVSSDDIDATTKTETPTTASVVKSIKPLTTYSTEFLINMGGQPTLSRNVAVCGSLHHGKTLFVDCLIRFTHERVTDPYELETKYTDTRKDERKRGLGIKATPVSLILPSLKGKSHLFNVIDCPGHINFIDESVAAFRLCDGAILVVDVVEGVTATTEALMIAAVRAHLDIVLVINKIDRLILELRLPPTDAYFKIRHTIESVNAVLSKAVSMFAKIQDNIDRDVDGNSTNDYIPRSFSPAAGNVCFGSGLFGLVFSLQSWSQMFYIDKNNKFNNNSMDCYELAKRLWGDAFYDSNARRFVKSAPKGSSSERSFVEFVLNPLYKLIGTVVGELPESVESVANELDIRIRKDELHLDIKPLLRLMCSRFAGRPIGFADMCTQFIRSPFNAASDKASLCYTGSLGGPIGLSICSCDPNGPLMMQTTKMYPKEDLSSFDALCRIFSGSVRVGDAVRVLGESYSPEDDEDAAHAIVTSLWIHQGRYKIPLQFAVAGQWVLVEGITSTISKTATITNIGAHGSNAIRASDLDDEVSIFSPLSFGTQAVYKLSIEPLNPSELPKMLEGLRSINKSYPLSTTKVEESGEHVIVGTGELYLDCIMHDLRVMYSEIEIKVADPVVSFCETVVESSALQCFAASPNQKNKLTMIAEPLEKGLAEAIENGKISLAMSKKEISSFLTETYEWDVLAARSIWAFGPGPNGPNIFIDDSLPSENVDRSALISIRDSIVQGFQWCAREGPLCDDPIRGTKFRLLDASIASEPIYRGGGQIIPTARRAAYSAFLMATPRLMEPILSVEIFTPADCIAACYTVVSRRRGHVVGEEPKAGTPLFVVNAMIPVIDSFGFETDLRTYTQGMAFCQQMFSHWEVVPGDPLDKSIRLRPLEPAPMQHLAREFMIKTRRRKGLSEDVSINKFFDAPMLLELAKQGIADADRAAIGNTFF